MPALYPHSGEAIPLRGVIFDYGNTLVSVDPALHSKRTDYADVVAVPGAERMTRHLESRGLLPRAEGLRFLDRFLAIREANRMRADESGDEIPASVSLRETFRDGGLPEPGPEEIAPALERFFSVEEELLEEIPGAGTTLRALEERGVALALLSNATDGDYIRRALARFGWRDRFRPLVVSSDIGVRKPRPEAFQAVLRDWPFAPEEIAVVGDSLRHDVGGAHALGLAAFHLTWIPNPWDPVCLGRIVPSGSATTHAELLPLLLSACAG
jgi:HAD superfamily hydrolase (TIGR01509 family)